MCKHTHVQTHMHSYTYAHVHACTYTRTDKYAPNKFYCVLVHYNFGLFFPLPFCLAVFLCPLFSPPMEPLTGAWLGLSTKPLQSG